MKLTILAAGKLREPWVREGCAEYQQRIIKHLPFEILEVKDSPALRPRIPDRHRLIALDERGRPPTSQELAHKLATWMNAGLPGACFLIGDADGLPPDLLTRADELLSLSRLTLPHRMRAFVQIRG